MKNRKLIKILIGTWAVTTVLIFVGLIVQMALPTILKKAKYIEMLFDEKQSIILALISLIVTYGLVFMYSSSSTKIQKYSVKISKRKPTMILVTAFSVFICLLFVLIDYSTIARSVIYSNNVENIEGTVEKVQSVSLSSNGKVVNLVTVADSNGKKYKLVPDKNLMPPPLHKNDKAVIDYVPSKNSTPKQADGKVLGYKAQSYNESKEEIRGILEDIEKESELDKK